MPNYWYHHIHLVSPDPRKTAQFYQDMFNAKMVNTTELPDGRVSIEISLNSSIVLLMQKPVQEKAAPATDTAANGLDHFGIRTDDIEATVTDLKAKGVKFRDDIREIRDGMKIAYIWAPENVLIELIQADNWTSN